MKSSLIFLFSFLFSSAAFGAACCGGGIATPSIISGDDRAQFTTSYSLTEVVIDHVDARGVWSKWEDHQQVQAFRLEGAHLLSDRWQAGLVLPIIQRTHLDQTSSGLGDVSASVGYEYLSDWNYNPLRPKGIGFLQLTLPTGKSRAESEVGGLDSRGNGFLALGFGTLLTKTWSKHDSFLTLDVHRSFAKDFSTSFGQGRLVPGYGGSFGVGYGYSFADLRVGSSLRWTYEDPIAIEGNLASRGSAERFATALVSASYLMAGELSWSLTYADQTLFGSPVNTSLGRTVAIVLQKRWIR